MLKLLQICNRCGHVEDISIEEEIRTIEDIPEEERRIWMEGDKSIRGTIQATGCARIGKYEFPYLCKMCEERYDRRVNMSLGDFIMEGITLRETDDKVGDVANE